MGGITFTTLQPGADLATAFETARHHAAETHGWREDNGTIATKTRVTLVHRDTMTLDTARELATELLRRHDQPYCDHYDTVAAAIPIADTAGALPPTGWLFFGVACD